MIEKDLCQRQEDDAKGMMTIPKFRKVWNATKKFYTADFIKFMDVL